ncbi:MAG TPA: BON domain-containing protein [Bryobacteraceae bacterium]|nr:BON domain-containing protein [Bryobacteraceae bacterium]
MKAKSVVAFLLVFVLAAAVLAGAQKQQTPPSDDSLYDLVRRKLASDPVVKGGALEVDVKQGIVTLRGKVELEKQKERATKLAKKVKGVKDVDNQIAVVGKGGR